MKKAKWIVGVLLCAVLLGGCSAGGDCVNCFTNGCASFFEMWACIGNSMCAKCTVSLATCGVCGGMCDSCGTYDCLTGYTCYSCAEQCRSHISEFDTTHVVARENYIMGECGITDIKKLGSVNYEYAKKDFYYKISAQVMLTFAYDYTADNVWVECKINTKGVNGVDSTVTSTRWLGTVKKSQKVTIEPAFYVSFSSTYSREAMIPSNYNFTVTVYYGEK